MNIDSLLKTILNQESGRIEAPPEIKKKVLESIDRLLLAKALLELIVIIPVAAARSLAPIDENSPNK